jgi:predicted peptidase
MELKMFAFKKFLSQKFPLEHLNYLEYIPQKADQKLPLLIYVHGAGSRGSDLRQMARIGPLREPVIGKCAEALIVAPQCHENSWFDLFHIFTEFIEYNIKRDIVDENRIYIVGVSMGAYATWQMCMSHPDWFAAAVPICGGGMYWNAQRLIKLPIWAFHGALDTVVLPSESKHMVDAVNKHGGDAKLTIFENDQHNSWDNAFATDEMWEWLFMQKNNLNT